MNSHNGKIAEISLPEVEQKTLATSPGGFKIFNRIVDWITSDRMQLINVTERINEIDRKSGIRDGIVHLQSLHTTTAVFINEWQDALVHERGAGAGHRSAEAWPVSLRIPEVRPFLIYRRAFIGG